MMVDHEDPLGTQQAGRGGGHQPHRAGAEDGDARPLADGRIDGRHVAGRQDVRQEEHLLVAQPRVGDDERAYVALRNSDELGLAPRYATVEMAVSEQCRPWFRVLLVHDGATTRIGRLAGREKFEIAVEALPA